jgi:hypothetical protein
MISSPKKRVRFGELQIREFDRAAMGEHPLTKGGFALQLGQRYLDLPPVAIPNKERMKRGVKRRSPRQRKKIWKKQLRFEQELLNRGLCGRILRVGKKGSTDEQRFFERQDRAKKPLLEQTMDEQRWFEYQTPLERRLEQQPPRKFASERKWNRRRRRWIRQWRADQAIIDRQFKRWRRAMREKMERKRVRREIREKMERRRLRRELRETEQRRLLELQAIHHESAQQDAMETNPVYVLGETVDLRSFLSMAWDLASVSVILIVFFIVSFLLDTLFRLSICKSCIKTLVSNGCVRHYRHNVSLCVQYCKRHYCCVCTCLSVFLCLCVSVLVVCC